MIRFICKLIMLLFVFLLVSCRSAEFDIDSTVEHEVVLLVSTQVAALPTATIQPTYTANPTYTSAPAYLQEATYTPNPTYTPLPTLTPNPTLTPYPSPTATSTSVPATAVTQGNTLINNTAESSNSGISLNEFSISLTRGKIDLLAYYILPRVTDSYFDSETLQTYSTKTSVVDCNNAITVYDELMAIANLVLSANDPSLENVRQTYQTGLDIFLSEVNWIIDDCRETIANNGSEWELDSLNNGELRIALNDANALFQQAISMINGE